jgi:putative intracellular protease/amidase
MTGAGAAPKIVGLVTHPNREDANRLADRLAQRLGAGGVDVRRWRDGDDVAGFVDDLDLVISLGGDGTRIRTF